VQEVNQLLAARKEMEKMMKQMGKGKMPSIPQLQENGAQAAPRPSATRKSKNKRKKKKSRR
jgi:signal recognition particle GTPase